EHPVTEMITGLDIVRLQIEIAAGLPLPFTQDDVRFNGHAVECRINAEHPRTFMPSPGMVSTFHQPGGPGVRVDSHLYSGYTVPPDYDSLVAKLITHGASRRIALARMSTALSEVVVEGIQTNVALHADLCRDAAFVEGGTDIHYLERKLKSAST
ncbi:MAG: acetyl-CoA carboxylase biotin carboxylase subunit, partial [Gammaproteobacteria bacterium]|nr:acetyl-CoA carboxylase biotin carboxylase subunit [Gammaproteobacteria bacterium]